MNAIIFDGDDTLWQTQILYDQAKERFYSLMNDQGFDHQTVSTKLNEIDLKNTKTFGFSKQRFPHSMKEVYEYFCVTKSMVADPVILERVYEIGISPFQSTPQLMDDAKEVLKTLKKSFSIYLYTGGDPDVQTSKIQELELTQYFKAIYICDRKTEIELKNILEEQSLNVDRVWMIGNSLKSDINPALRLGVKCIWVQSHTWEYDNEVLLETNVPKVDALWQIPAIINNSQTTTT